MSGTAAPLEVAWTIAAVGGLVFSAWLAFTGLRDRAALQVLIDEHPPRARRLGPRWWVALSAVVANTALCYVWLVFLGIGLLAMRYPPPPNPEQHVSSPLFGWLLLSAETMLAGVQGWHLWVRNRVNHADRWQPS